MAAASPTTTTSGIETASRRVREQEGEQEEEEEEAQGTPALMRGVARAIGWCLVGGGARDAPHGRKSRRRRHRFEGYKKRHVLRDLPGQSGLVRAVGITAANAAQAPA